MLTRNQYQDRLSWLEGRKGHLTASELATACEVAKWKTIDQLYDEKTGLATPKDISEEPQIVHGVEGEPIVRAEFQWLYPQFKYDYHAFDILFQENDPYISATLDGELTYIGDPKAVRSPTGYIGTLTEGMQIVHEIKCPTVLNKAMLSEWIGSIPKYYLAQVCGQFLATRWEAVILTSKVREIARSKGEDDEWSDDIFVRIHTFNYAFFLRDPFMVAEIQYAYRKAMAFKRSIESGVRPATAIKSFE